MTASAMPGAALELVNVSKSFGGVQALKAISLEVHPGEVVALVGDNGAGKSTAIKIIAGVLRPSSGSIIIHGDSVEMLSPEHAKSVGLEVVYQDLALANRQPVYMNMFLGREQTNRFGLLAKNSMREETRAILDSLDVQVPSVDVSIESLSGGQRQGVAIGRATHWSRGIVLMDEPTAALGFQETSKVEQVIDRMKSVGKAILIVSHNLEQVFRIADRVYVLRQGTVIGERKIADSSAREIVAMITGAEK